MQVYTYKQSALTRQKVHQMHQSSVVGVEDMAALEDLHDGAIMHNLFLRYRQRHIYVSNPTPPLGGGLPPQVHTRPGLTHRNRPDRQAANQARRGSDQSHDRDELTEPVLRAG